MKWYWSICRQTTCASACMKAKSISQARPNAPSNIFSAKATSSPCASWPYAAPPIALMTRCEPGVICRGRNVSGIRGMPFCYALVTAAATKNWSAPPPGLPRNSAASGMRCTLKRRNSTLCLKTSAAPFWHRYAWRRSWGPKLPRSPILRKIKPSCVTPVSIIWARLSLAVVSIAAGLAVNLLPTGWPAARPIWIW